MAGMDNEVLYGTRCRVNDGSVSAPAFTYASDLDSGIYRIGANNQAVSCGGVSPMNWTDTLTSCTSQFYALVTELSHILERTTATTNTRITPLVVRLLCSGTALNGFGPDIDFQGENSAGSTVSFGRVAFYASDVTAGSVDGVMLVRVPINSVDTDVFFANGNQAGFRDGTVSLPGISFINDSGLGIYRQGSGNFSAASGGNEIWRTTGGSFLTQQILGVNGGWFIDVNRTATDISPNTNQVLISVTDTSVQRTVTLPASPSNGQIYIIKDASGAAATNNIVVTVSGGVKTIDGSVIRLISSNYGAMSVYYDSIAGNYFIF